MAPPPRAKQGRGPTCTCILLVALAVGFIALLVVQFEVFPSAMPRQGLRQALRSLVLESKTDGQLPESPHAVLAAELVRLKALQEMKQAQFSAPLKTSTQLKANKQEQVPRNNPTTLPKKAPRLKAEAQGQPQVQSIVRPEGRAAKSSVAPMVQEQAQVLRYMSAPSTLPYNFTSYDDLCQPTVSKSLNKCYVGQVGQDIWADRVFGGARGLFVVESGANDGESESNSLFLETQRGWDCLLIEANPYLVEKIQLLNRKCQVLASGLSLTGAVGSFPFKLAGTLGGFTSTLFQKERVID